MPLRDRIYDIEGDGRSKFDYLQEMLSHTLYRKQLLFKAVLMDTWYATLKRAIEAINIFQIANPDSSAYALNKKNNKKSCSLRKTEF